MRAKSNTLGRPWEGGYVFKRLDPRREETVLNYLSF